MTMRILLFHSFIFTDRLFDAKIDFEELSCKYAHIKCVFIYTRTNTIANKKTWMTRNKNNELLDVIVANAKQVISL